MKILNNLLIVVCLLTSTISHANDIRSFREQHRQLLAEQTIVHNKAALREQRLRITVNNDETFTSNWDNKKFNPYGDDVDLNTNIDLRDFVKPIKHADVSHHFGKKLTQFRTNEGVDFEVTYTDTIVSSFEGKVRKVAYSRDKYGFYVIIRHTNGLETLYGNLSKTFVRPNDYVRAGQMIGYCHAFSENNTFHFETRYKGKLLNPEKLINFTTSMPLQSHVNAKNALPVVKQQTRQVTKKRKH